MPIVKGLSLFGNQIGIVLECILIDKCKMLVKRVSSSSYLRENSLAPLFNFKGSVDRLFYVFIALFKGLTFINLDSDQR